MLVLVITTTSSDVASATKPPILNENGDIQGVGCQHKGTLARDYRGRANITKGGIPCQRWSDTQPHDHEYDVGDHNTAGIQLEVT